MGKWRRLIGAGVVCLGVLAPAATVTADGACSAPLLLDRVTVIVLFAAALK